MSAQETGWQGHKSAPWRCQSHPSLLAWPPQDHQLPGSERAPCPSAAGRTLQRKATSRDSRQVARPFPQGQRDKLLQEQPSDRPLPRMPSATTWNSEAHSLWIFGRGERETEKLIPTGGLKLPPKVKNLKTWRFYKELLVLQASKREGSPGPKSSPARTSSPSAVSNTGTPPPRGLPPGRQACKT